MSNAKRGFVFYFDLCPMVDALPPDQRGWLLSALCTYADRVWRDLTVIPEEISRLYPQLSQQTLMAFRFLASVVLRDTQKWLNQREARAQRRQQQGRGPAASAPAVSSAAESPQALERSRQETQRLQHLVAQLRRENEGGREAGPQGASGTASCPECSETPTPPAGW